MHIYIYIINEWVIVNHLGSDINNENIYYHLKNMFYIRHTNDLILYKFKVYPL